MTPTFAIARDRRCVAEYEVRSARDGREAWEIFQTEGADVIISDWLMPRMQGTELCRLVRATEASRTSTSSS